jgi:hypothetical protein
MGWLLVGSIPGVLLGSQFSLSIPERALRMAFAFVLVLSGIKLSGMPASTTIIEIAGPIGIAAFVVWSVRVLRQRSVPAQDAA